MYTHIVLAVHDALGRHQKFTNAMVASVQGMPRYGGTLTGKVISHIIIDPGSMQLLLDMDFALDNGIPYRESSTMMIGLANGSVEMPEGEIHRGLPLNITGILVTMDFPIIRINRAYSLLLGANWLRRIQATADYITGEYGMETPSRWLFIKNTPLGCEVLHTEWKMIKRIAHQSRMLGILSPRIQRPTPIMIAMYVPSQVAPLIIQCLLRWRCMTC